LYWLQRLNQHLAALARQAALDSASMLDTTGLPWATALVDDASCSGCQLCARFCPTGALNYLWGEMDEGVVFNLTFHPACAWIAISAWPFALRTPFAWKKAYVWAIY